ncbi:uncharacterized protein LOC108484311 isoform X3 [Gossypium arboreum]|uniref:uncharacterized protein LOC108484311 isoform X3 n=1 Tax=Gossypium arboreum TaxID=29729 RepID=UPI0022F14EC7|nr:uncharacterized protein LOC108484311 isoform X3 [Gossypium arboreum]
MVSVSSCYFLQQPTTITRHLLSSTRHVCCIPHVPPHLLTPYKYQFKIVNLSIAGSRVTETEMEVNGGAVSDPGTIRSQFLQLLRTRRNAQVPMTVEPAKPVVKPLFQDVTPPTFSEAMESCPKANIGNLKELLKEENLYLHTEALVSSWKNGDTMPFIFDTVWDLIKLADYLTGRDDIDPTKIGITGESLGGMHASFAAFADTRYAVAAPIIGVQGFRWAIDNDKWQARVDSIKAVFEEARTDLGKNEIDKEVVEKVWDRIAPGLASQFDAPNTVPAIAPRPLLIVNGAEDPRCPLEGLEIPKTRAYKAYGDAHSDKFKLVAEPGIGHQMTPLMVKEASDWFDQFLK